MLKTKLWLLSSVLAVNLCYAASAEHEEIKSVSGVLAYFPSHVQSQQAWYGHNFMVDNTPIKPTTDFPHDMLLRYVGKRIKVSGIWFKGEPFQNENAQLPMPMTQQEASQPQTVMRNDGILVQTLRLLKNP